MKTVYENVVTKGPLRISIFANRKVIDAHTIEVQFYRTRVELFGKKLVERNIETPIGIWKQIFVGQVTIDDDDHCNKKEGETMLLRVMNTPKLFILKQTICKEY